MSTMTKPSSAQSSSSTLPPSRKEARLMDLLKDEIAEQTWQFEAERVARMLSPKKLKPKSPWSHEHGGYATDPLVLPSPDDFDFVVDDVDPSTGGKRIHYAPLAHYLNACVMVADQVYKKVVKGRKKSSQPDSRFSLVEIDKRYWSCLVFHKYDYNAGDSVGGAPPVKPDLVGAELKSVPSTCYWKLPLDIDKINGPIAKIEIAVEVKESWSQLLWQGATYESLESFVEQIQRPANDNLEVLLLAAEGTLQVPIEVGCVCQGSTILRADSVTVSLLTDFVRTAAHQILPSREFAQSQKIKNLFAPADPVLTVSGLILTRRGRGPQGLDAKNMFGGVWFTGPYHEGKTLEYCTNGSGFRTHGMHPSLNARFPAKGYQYRKHNKTEITCGEKGVSRLLDEQMGLPQIPCAELSEYLPIWSKI
ncbi:hypothetical protein GGU11DRAFT_809981 [Lentinula aff. detonsa]|nr:hypothetical protein GGU11DRAFT_809981 [Lentinula aff. detonsa]